MKLSIVIPTKNEAVLLPRLLASVREQNFSDYEIIVADAHSNDRTCEIAQSFGARVVEGGMPGPGRNRGATAAQGDIVMFLDADVILTPSNFLHDVVHEFTQLGADVATCRLIPLSDRIDDRFGYETFNTFAQLTQDVRPHSVGSCIIARRNVHESLRGFDESVVFAEDMEYVQRAHVLGYRFRVLLAHPVSVSVRRLEKDGRLAIAVKYLYGGLYMLFKGPFRHMPYTYEMGGDDPAKK